MKLSQFIELFTKAKEIIGYDPNVSSWGNINILTDEITAEQHKQLIELHIQLNHNKNSCHSDYYYIDLHDIPEKTIEAPILPAVIEPVAIVEEKKEDVA